MAVIETFEDVVGNWVLDVTQTATGTVTRSSDYADAGTYSAKCFTTASGDVASVYDTISSVWGDVGWDPPGVYFWQRLRVYIPSATASALTGAEYMDIAGVYASAGGEGWWLRVKAGSALYCVGYDTGGSGPQEFNIYCAVPVGEWFDLEIGLNNLNDGGTKRAFAILINGDFYGWFRMGYGAGTINRLAAGILATNSADDLSVYLDTWYEYGITATPVGTDNRLVGDSYIKDCTAASGEHIEYQQYTWYHDPRMDASGIWSHDLRFQGGVHHELMPSMNEGWSEITAKWVDDVTPSWPPVLFDENYFAAMISFRKNVYVENNLEIVPTYSAGNVLLIYDAWVGGSPTVLGSWQMPDDGDHPIMGNGDKIFVNWRMVDASSLRVIVDYYDASAAAWSNRVIDTTDDITSIDGANFTGEYYKTVGISVDSPEYAVSRQSLGILSTSPRKRLTESTDSDSTEAGGVTTTTTVYIETDTWVSVELET